MASGLHAVRRAQSDSGLRLACASGGRPRSVRRLGDGALRSDGVLVSDVEWLMRYLGRETDERLRAELLPNGATAHNAVCPTQPLRMRIQELQQIAGAGQRTHAWAGRP